MPLEAIEDLKNIVGKDNLTTTPAQLTSGSKDCYHFSPVLIPQLDGCAAEVIAFPQTQDQLVAILSLAARHKIPVTPRGAGTGNYGQGVPLQGGILVNTRHLDRIVELTPEYARVEAGVILYNIEKEAEKMGAELRVFPSTVPTSSSAGFICGGSGGIGSIEHGMLWEGDNVRGATIYTIEESPQRIELTRDEMEGVLHNCGLTAFVSEVEFGLAPKTQWNQYIIAFDSLTEALNAAETFAETPARKRLVTVFEWPVPSFFKPLVKKDLVPDGKSCLFIYSDAGLNDIRDFAETVRGEVTFNAGPQEGKGRGTQLYDYTWNHTTQWAMKTDPTYTYLQERFEISRMHEQIAARKAAFPGEVLEHVEFTRSEGTLQTGGLSIIKYTSAERLREIIDFCESIDIRISNPHTYFLNDDNRWYGEKFLERKSQWDAAGLLNPGHLR